MLTEIFKHDTHFNLYRIHYQVDETTKRPMIAIIGSGDAHPSAYILFTLHKGIETYICPPDEPLDKQKHLSMYPALYERFNNHVMRVISDYVVGMQDIITINEKFKRTIESASTINTEGLAIYAGNYKPADDSKVLYHIGKSFSLKAFYEDRLNHLVSRYKTILKYMETYLMPRTTIVIPLHEHAGHEVMINVESDRNSSTYHFKVYNTNEAEKKQFKYFEKTFSFTIEHYTDDVTFGELPIVFKSSLALSSYMDFVSHQFDRKGMEQDAQFKAFVDAVSYFKREVSIVCTYLSEADIENYVPAKNMGTMLMNGIIAILKNEFVPYHARDENSTK